MFFGSNINRFKEDKSGEYEKDQLQHPAHKNVIRFKQKHWIILDNIVLDQCWLNMKTLLY